MLGVANYASVSNLTLKGYPIVDLETNVNDIYDTRWRLAQRSLTSMDLAFYGYRLDGSTGEYGNIFGYFYYHTSLTSCKIGWFENNPYYNFDINGTVRIINEFNLKFGGTTGNAAKAGIWWNETIAILDCDNWLRLTTGGNRYPVIASTGTSGSTANFMVTPEGDPSIPVKYLNINVNGTLFKMLYIE